MLQLTKGVEAFVSEKDSLQTDDDFIKEINGDDDFGFDDAKSAITKKSGRAR